MRYDTVSKLARTIAVAGVIACAQVASAASAPTLASLDTNKDGKVSLNEASANDALFVAFKKLDADRDGMLTQAEFAAWSGS